MDVTPAGGKPSDTDIWQKIISGQSAGSPLNDQQRLDLFCRFISSGKLYTLVPILPLLLNLDESPYSLVDHFPFEGLFETAMPRKTVVLTGRQVSKSTSIAAHGVVLAAARRRFQTLYVTPLFEQIRRFSSNYVRPFIEESPIRPMLIGVGTEKSVLQRSFKNKSIMHFSYASLTADRARGIKADRCAFDEVQDLDPDHIPIIEESMSHSSYGISQYTGTPKTRDNTIEVKWEQSSMAEWVIKCSACKKYNIPSLDHDLDKMIGPWHEDIGEFKNGKRPGTICAKCGKAVDPRTGRWVHRHAERRQLFAGYHIPQIIMPIHYSNPEKWSVLLSKRNLMGAATFYNEVLGESCDIATKLVTKTELERAGSLNKNTEEEAVKKLGHYQHRVLAVDWGGGGEEGVSYTAVAVMGFRLDGHIDVIYGKKLPNPQDHVGEARECRRLFSRFHCQLLAHDYTGAGNLRETVMVQTGMAQERLMPISYVRTASHNVLTYKPATDQHPRSYWQVDKARSLQLTCYSIKLGMLKFFEYDYKSPEQPGLLHDFLALVENKVPTSHGSDIYTIQRNPLLSDDFAQAVNIGCCALWHMHNAWPNFGSIEQKWKMDIDAEKAMGPIEGNPWVQEESTMGGYFDRF